MYTKFTFIYVFYCLKCVKYIFFFLFNSFSLFFSALIRILIIMKKASFHYTLLISKFAVDINLFLFFLSKFKFDIVLNIVSKNKVFLLYLFSISNGKISYVKKHIRL